MGGWSAKVDDQKVLGAEGRTRFCATSGGEDCKILGEGNVAPRLVLVLKMWGRRDDQVAEKDLYTG